MRASISGMVAALVVFAGCAGTGSCRYVYQDGQFGVIGIPENSDHWPTRYRSRAERMMKEHFPGGYEIVRAEEVVEGTRTRTTEGSSTAEIVPTLPLELLEICKIGHTSKQTQSDSLMIKESRIVYRRADRIAAEGYATLAHLAPTAYIDPNAAERPKHPGRDPDVVVAHHEDSPSSSDPEDAPAADLAMQ